MCPFQHLPTKCWYHFKAPVSWCLKNNLRENLQNKKKHSCGNLETTQLPPTGVAFWLNQGAAKASISLMGTPPRGSNSLPWRSKTYEKKRNDLKETKRINGSIVCEPEIELLGAIIFQISWCEVLETKQPMALHWSLWTTIRWWVHHLNLGRVGGSSVKACQKRQGFWGPMKSYRNYIKKSWITMVCNSKIAFV